MTRAFQLLLFGFQVVTTFSVLLVLYLVLALLDYRGGFDNLIGLTLWQPLMGVALSFVTLLICLLVGLPLRFYSRLRNWWQQHWYIALGGAVVGLGVLGLSLISRERLSPLPSAISGWLLLAFSLLHIVPPTHLFSRWIPFKE